MYTLKVSHDAGYTYRDYGQSGNLEELEAQGKKYDDEGLRWVIEDGVGDIVAASLIHKQIIDFMQKVNQDSV